MGEAGEGGKWVRLVGGMGGRWWYCAAGVDRRGEGLKGVCWCWGGKCWGFDDGVKVEE